MTHRESKERGLQTCGIYALSYEAVEGSAKIDVRKAKESAAHCGRSLPLTETRGDEAADTHTTHVCIRRRR
jgi:hypothetical protein